MPTQYVRNVWKRLAGHVPAGVPIVSVAKGIENQTLFRPTQIVMDVVGRGRSLAALSGPNIAAELADIPATAVAASEDRSSPAASRVLFQPNGSASIPIRT